MAIECLVDRTQTAPPPQELYSDIEFPEAPGDRPYVFINMASTIDGKIVLKERGGNAAGIGGPTDQLLFRRLQMNADAALIGGGTLRASQVIYPPEMLRFVATRTGDLPLQNRFFRDAPGRAFVIVPEDLSPEKLDILRAAANVVQVGEHDIDWPRALNYVRTELNVRALLCEGGAQLNDQMIRMGLADELFLTLAPKLKGGAHLPTIMTGDGYPPDVALPASLISIYHDSDEIYLRYRLGDNPRTFGPTHAKSKAIA